MKSLDNPIAKIAGLAIVVMLLIKFGLPLITGGGFSLPNLGASATGAMNSLSGAAGNAVQDLQSQPEAQFQQSAPPPSVPTERKSLWGGGQSAGSSQPNAQQGGHSGAGASFGSVCNADGAYDPATGLSCRQCGPNRLRWSKVEQDGKYLVCLDLD